MTLLNDQQFTMVPWSSWDEWIQVYTLLFSNDSASRSQGVDHVLLWMNRGNLPGAIECTMHLIQSLDSTSPPPVLLSQYSHSISRLCTCVLDSAQTYRARSLLNIAHEIDFPLQLVELRNLITHASLPFLHSMKHGVELGLEWIRRYYWEVQLNKIEESRGTFQKCIEELRKFITESRKTLSKNYAQIDQLFDRLVNKNSKTFLTEIFNILIDPSNDLLLSRGQKCPRKQLTPCLLHLFYLFNRKFSNFFDNLFVTAIKWIAENPQESSISFLCQSLSWLLRMNFSSAQTYRSFVVACNCFKCPDVKMVKLSQDKVLIGQDTVDVCLGVLLKNCCSFIDCTEVLSFASTLCNLYQSGISNKQKMMQVLSIVSGMSDQSNDVSDDDLMRSISQLRTVNQNFRISSLYSPCLYGTVFNKVNDQNFGEETNGSEKSSHDTCLPMVQAEVEESDIEILPNQLPSLNPSEISIHPFEFSL
ncbi:hypothetical protein P9112_000504 [Eukaryota sp. TZLM1-RC]